MLIGLIGIISMPLAGLSVDYLGARYTILLSALFMIPAVVIYLKMKNADSKKIKSQNEDEKTMRK